MNGIGIQQTSVANDPQIRESVMNRKPLLGEQKVLATRKWQAEHLRLLWSSRWVLVRATVVGLLASTLTAFLIPKAYTSTTQLMPPDAQSASGMAMMASLAAKAGGGLGLVAGDMLGLKSSGALFIGVLRSQTSQERLIEQFDLRKVYRQRLVADARAQLDKNTSIHEDRTSGIIAISVTDYSPERAAALAKAYVDELNSLASELSTSSAHRERVFLEDRLKLAKSDLDDATNELAQFSSKNNTLDIQQEGKAMLDAAGALAGEMIAGQSELEGLRRIYTNNNSRVKSLSARVAELRKELEKLGGGAPGNSVVNDAALPDTRTQGAMPYPSIRSLPLLGAKYADYYRRAKIQETVYELLTEQYELAKVQEAKETPSVKILDPAKTPEKKSFPPRLLIVFLGTFCADCVSLVCILASSHWHQADADDPRKILAQEVIALLKAGAPWGPPNGNGMMSGTQRFWSRLNGHRPPTDGPSVSSGRL